MSRDFVCVWWHDFDCSTAPQFYSLNAQLYVTPEGGAAPQEPIAPGAPEEGPEGPVISPAGPAAPAPGRPGERPVVSRPGGAPGGPVSRPGGAPGGPASRPGGVPTRGRPGARPSRPGIPGVSAPVDAEGFGPEEPTDERITTGQEQVVEGQEPQLPEGEGITQQVGVDFDETPAPEVVTVRPVPAVRPTSPRAPNGRPPAGVKGGRRNGVTRNGLGYELSDYL
jgi:hypothetical protein